MSKSDGSGIGPLPEFLFTKANRWANLCPRRVPGENEKGLAEANPLFLLARPKRFELLTPWFVAKYSIQLSYGRLREPHYTRKRQSGVSNDGGERGIRTLDTGLSPYASLAGKCLRPLGQLSARGRNNTRLRLKNQTKSGLFRLLPVQMPCAVRGRQVPCIFLR